MKKFLNNLSSSNLVIPACSILFWFGALIFNLRDSFSSKDPVLASTFVKTVLMSLIFIFASITLAVVTCREDNKKILEKLDTQDKRVELYAFKLLQEELCRYRKIFEEDRANNFQQEYFRTSINCHLEDLSLEIERLENE